jgi:hypothetical protein
MRLLGTSGERLRTGHPHAHFVERRESASLKAVFLGEALYFDAYVAG